MIEVYSTNVTASANASIPLTNVSLLKGVTATKEGNTIALNKCGIYAVTFDGSLTVPTGGTVNIQLKKNGVDEPESLVTVTGTAGNIVPFSKSIYIQVPFSNTPSPCTAPTLIDIVNDVETVYPNFNITVSKLV